VIHLPPISATNWVLRTTVVLVRCSDWSDTGRRRRVYRLTSKGQRELGIRRRRWREFASTVQAVLA
jgi:DNA-binding PadR family transcriptional regulator